MTVYTPLAPSWEISLTKAEEYLAIAASRAGNGRAQNRLAQSMYVKLAKHVQRNYRWISPLAPAEILVQEGMFGFKEALEKFDCSTGFRFWTFFRWLAEKYIKLHLETIYNKNGKTDWDLSLDRIGSEGEPPQFADEYDVFEVVESSLMNERHRFAIREALSPLPWIDRKIIALKFACDWSYSRISEHLGVPLSTASWRVRKAVDALRERLSQILERPVTLAELGWQPEPEPEELPLPPESVPSAATAEPPADPNHEASSEPPESSSQEPPSNTPPAPPAASTVHPLAQLLTSPVRHLAPLLSWLLALRSQSAKGSQGRSPPRLSELFFKCLKVNNRHPCPWVDRLHLPNFWP